jgi:hypothetical protein
LWEQAGIFWGADSIEGSFGAVNEDLILLTGRISLYVLGDPMVHTRLEEVPLGLPNRFVLPGVACSGMIMNQGHKVSLLGFGYSINDDRSCKFLRWEYDYIPVVFFALVGSWGSRKDVWSCVSFPRYVVNDEVIFLQVHMPLGRSLIEVL